MKIGEILTMRISPTNKISTDQVKLIQNKIRTVILARIQTIDDETEAGVEVLTKIQWPI